MKQATNLQFSDQALARIRQELCAPPPAQGVWNERLTIEEKLFMLKAAGAPDDLRHKRWESLHPIHQKNIAQAVRRWVKWASEFAGVF